MIANAASYLLDVVWKPRQGNLDLSRILRDIFCQFLSVLKGIHMGSVGLMEFFGFPRCIWDLWDYLKGVRVSFLMIFPSSFGNKI